MKKKWYEIVANLLHIKVSENKEIVDLVLEGLERNKELYHARFCPCEFERKIENVCPCLKLRETGVCKCGLFECKKNEN